MVQHAVVYYLLHSYIVKGLLIFFIACFFIDELFLHKELLGCFRVVFICSSFCYAQNEVIKV